MKHLKKFNEGVLDLIGLDRKADAAKAAKAKNREEDEKDFQAMEREIYSKSIENEKKPEFLEIKNMIEKGEIKKVKLEDSKSYYTNAKRYKILLTDDRIVTLFWGSTWETSAGNYSLIPCIKINDNSLPITRRTFEDLRNMIDEYNKF